MSTPPSIPPIKAKAKSTASSQTRIRPRPKPKAKPIKKSTILKPQPQSVGSSQDVPMEPETTAAPVWPPVKEEEEMEIQPETIASMEPKIEEEHDQEEEEDEVIREIEVYISPSLSSTLNVLQFPITPITQHPSSLHPSGARIRPIQNILELDYPINDLGKYSETRGMGMSTPATSIAERRYTSKTIPLKTHMAMGLYSPLEDTLHLIPLQNSLKQMRPSFRHIDEALGTSTPGVEEEDTGPKQITLKKSGGSSNVPLTRRRMTIATQRHQEESEDFVDLEVFPMGSSEWKNARRAIEQNVSDKQKHEVRADPKGYIQTLNYLPNAVFPEDEEDHPSTLDVDNVEDKEDIPQDPNDILIHSLSSKITTYLLSSRGYPIPFTTVYRDFASKHQIIKHDPNIFLHALSGSSVMIRGSNVVLKTGLMTWLSEEMQVLRNFILLLLNRDGIVYSDILLSASSASSEEDVMELLGCLAKKGENCWTMKYDVDYRILEEAQMDHYAVMFRRYWLMKEVELKEFLERYDELVVSRGY